MKTKNLFLSMLTLAGLFAAPTFAADSGIGVVNLSTCIAESKLGKKEQDNLQNIQKELGAQMENTEKELKEILTKFEDTEYLDSLSPKAEEELRTKQQALQEDMGRYQNQFYQIMQQAQYQLYHKMINNISKASEKVAKQKKLDYVINKESCFYIRPDLDVTTTVISEMDKNFELDAKKLSDNSEDGAAPINAVEETLLNNAG